MPVRRNTLWRFLVFCVAAGFASVGLLTSRVVLFSAGACALRAGTDGTGF